LNDATTFDDLERPLTLTSRLYSSKSNISKTVQDTAIVTTER